MVRRSEFIKNFLHRMQKDLLNELPEEVDEEVMIEIAQSIIAGDVGHILIDIQEVRDGIKQQRKNTDEQQPGHTAI